jgi:hypothetical protein
MGSRGPPRFSRFLSGFGKWGAEALLSFRLPAWFVRRRGQRPSPLALPVSPGRGKQGGRGHPCFYFRSVLGMFPKTFERSALERLLRRRRHSLQEDRHRRDWKLSSFWFRVEMFSPLFQVCESCLVGCLMTCCHKP